MRDNPSGAAGHRDQNAPAERDRGTPGSETAQGGTEPAPTDYRKHVWLLVAILFVIVVAKLLSDSSSGKEQPPPGEPQALPLPTDQGAAPQAPMRPLSYAEMMSAQRRAAAMTRYTTIGERGLRMIVAAPPYELQGENKPHVGRLFNVSQVGDGVRVDDLLPEGFADQYPVIGQDPASPPEFRPAQSVSFLTPQERIVAVEAGGDIRGYPVRILRAHAGVRDRIGDADAVLWWSDLTQSARAYALTERDKDLRVGTSGRLLRGNVVFYDRASGSLWDSLTGRALTGERVGETLPPLRTTVHLWSAWQKGHPEALVLTTQTGFTGATEAGAYDDQTMQRYESYLMDPRLPFAVPDYDPQQGDPIQPKEFVLGVRIGTVARAYPLRALFVSRQDELREEVGGRMLTIVATSPRTADVASEDGEPVDATVMLWFGWRSAHPATEVWTPPAP